MKALSTLPLLLGCSLLTLGWGSTHAARAQEKPLAERHPVLRKLAPMVGGKWATEFKNADGVPVGEQRFSWGDGGKSLLSEGVLGQGTANPERTRVTISVDPASNEVYYLDQHGPHTVYFGHIRLEGETVVYQFKSLVGTPTEWLCHQTLVDKDHVRSTMWSVKDGKKSEKALQINLVRG